MSFKIVNSKSAYEKEFYQWKNTSKYYFTLIDPKQIVYTHTKCFKVFENNQIITTSRNITEHKKLPWT